MQPVRLCFVFYDIKSTKIRIATVAMFTCDLYVGVVPHMSPPPHDLERLRTTMVDFIVILNRGRSVVSWTLYVWVRYFIPLNGPLNGHPPSILYTSKSARWNKVATGL